MSATGGDAAGEEAPKFYQDAVEICVRDSGMRRQRIEKTHTKIVVSQETSQTSSSVLMMRDYSRLRHPIQTLVAPSSSYRRVVDQNSKYFVYALRTGLMRAVWMEEEQDMTISNKVKLFQAGGAPDDGEETKIQDLCLSKCGQRQGLVAVDSGGNVCFIRLSIANTPQQKSKDAPPASFELRSEVCVRLVPGEGDGAGAGGGRRGLGNSTGAAAMGGEGAGGSFKASRAFFSPVSEKKFVTFYPDRAEAVVWDLGLLMRKRGMQESPIMEVTEELVRECGASIHVAGEKEILEAVEAETLPKENGGEEMKGAKRVSVSDICMTPDAGYLLVAVGGGNVAAWALLGMDDNKQGVSVFQGVQNLLDAPLSEHREPPSEWEGAGQTGQEGAVSDGKGGVEAGPQGDHAASPESGSYSSWAPCRRRITQLTCADLGPKAAFGTSDGSNKGAFLFALLDAGLELRVFPLDLSHQKFAKTFPNHPVKAAELAQCIRLDQQLSLSASQLEGEDAAEREEEEGESGKAKDKETGGSKSLLTAKSFREGISALPGPHLLTSFGTLAVDKDSDSRYLCWNIGGGPHKGLANFLLLFELNSHLHPVVPELSVGPAKPATEGEPEGETTAAERREESISNFPVSSVRVIPMGDRLVALACACRPGLGPMHNTAAQIPAGPGRPKGKMSARDELGSWVGVAVSSERRDLPNCGSINLILFQRIAELRSDQEGLGAHAVAVQRSSAFKSTAELKTDREKNRLEREKAEKLQKEKEEAELEAERKRIQAEKEEAAKKAPPPAKPSGGNALLALLGLGGKPAAAAVQSPPPAPVVPTPVVPPAPAVVAAPTAPVPPQDDAIQAVLSGNGQSVTLSPSAPPGFAPIVPTNRPSGAPSEAEPAPSVGTGPGAEETGGDFAGKNILRMLHGGPPPAVTTERPPSPWLPPQPPAVAASDNGTANVPLSSSALAPPLSSSALKPAGTQTHTPLLKPGGTQETQTSPGMAPEPKPAMQAPPPPSVDLKALEDLSLGLRAELAGLRASLEERLFQLFGNVCEGLQGMAPVLEHQDRAIVAQTEGLARVEAESVRFHASSEQQSADLSRRMDRLEGEVKGVRDEIQKLSSFLAQAEADRQRADERHRKLEAQERQREKGQQASTTQSTEALSEKIQNLFRQEHERHEKRMREEITKIVQQEVPTVVAARVERAMPALFRTAGQGLLENYDSKTLKTLEKERPAHAQAMQAEKGKKAERDREAEKVNGDSSSGHAALNSVVPPPQYNPTPAPLPERGTGAAAWPARVMQQSLREREREEQEREREKQRLQQQAQAAAQQREREREKEAQREKEKQQQQRQVPPSRPPTTGQSGSLFPSAHTEAAPYNPQTRNALPSAKRDPTEEPEAEGSTQDRESAQQGGNAGASSLLFEMAALSDAEKRHLAADWTQNSQSALLAVLTNEDAAKKRSQMFHILSVLDPEADGLIGLSDPLYCLVILKTVVEMLPPPDQTEAGKVLPPQTLHDALRTLRTLLNKIEASERSLDAMKVNVPELPDMIPLRLQATQEFFRNQAKIADSGGGLVAVIDKTKLPQLSMLNKAALNASYSLQNTLKR
uniref:Uncharacterized protein n=1 Tax=Chromera velia CCMP2878 TaxID=1169474 RepID=A0A0G4HKZ6_9ALVE|eukprot:Cvel_7362.t1-p1 / transcript=Cvel_7362.t1 / gene=Cvel_7362 / organism=Chromera_velia_CCMP2878 / gene_product=hypothetical protein / transcript_product=hypothetical protein / location=Cvel_scaffold382:45860-60675(+) / protein_length=1587 / sequence_SO=supercontig / SO=protein_coding / is_pseudo=false